MVYLKVASVMENKKNIQQHQGFMSVKLRGGRQIVLFKIVFERVAETEFPFEVLNTGPL